MTELVTFFAAASANCLAADACNTGLPSVAADGGQLRVILQVVFGIVAALSVLMVTIGGLRLATSESNPDGVKQGRNTILFALVGLAIALSAEAIVSFFLGRV